MLSFLSCSFHIQIPTSFRYRRSNDQDQRRGRGRGFRRDPSNNELSMAIQASLETAIADGRGRETSSQPVIDQGEMSQADRVTGSRESPTVNSGTDAPPSSSAVNSQSSRNGHILEESYFPPLSDREPPEPSSRYVQVLSQGSAARLGEELFPPLPGARESGKPKQGAESSGNSTLASRLNRRKGTVKVLNLPQPRPLDIHEFGPSSSANFPQLSRPIQNQGLTTSTSNSKPKPTVSQVARASTSVRGNKFVSPISANPAWTSVSGSRMRHSSSAPDLVDAPKQPIANPAAVGKQVLLSNGQSLPSVEDVQTANKSLVERIHIGLGNDEEKYAAFKNISAEYRQGEINTWEYISYVEQFGLMHLVLELARLCPDPQKQKELIDAYNANIWNQVLQENGETHAGSSKESKQWKKGKGKGIVNPTDNGGGKEGLTNSFLDTVRKLQLKQKQQEEEVEVLSKDGYRTTKSISNSSSASVNLANSSSGSREPHMNSNSSSQNLVGGGGVSGENSKKKKKDKIPRFLRGRLGDDPEAIARANASPERSAEESSNKPSEEDPSPVRGAWKNNGGNRLSPRK